MAIRRPPLTSLMHDIKRAIKRAICRHLLRSSCNFLLLLPRLDFLSQIELARERDNCELKCLNFYDTVVTVDRQLYVR